MTNLLEETRETMADYGLSPHKIKFIGSSYGPYGCTWEEFETIADFEYDNDYGCLGVARDLIIVFYDGSWLERKEYDGSEWWDFRRPHKVLSSYKPITKLLCDNEYGHENLAGLN